MGIVFNKVCTGIKSGRMRWKLRFWERNIVMSLRIGGNYRVFIGILIKYNVYKF